MQGTERIPQRENSINRMLPVGSMHFQIHSQVTPVHICKQIGAQESMIHSCIENGTLVFIMGLDCNL